MVLKTILRGILNQFCPSGLYEDSHVDVIDSSVIFQKWGPCPDAVKVLMVISQLACLTC